MIITHSTPIGVEYRNIKHFSIKIKLLRSLKKENAGTKRLENESTRVLYRR